ncbi:type I-E CRISPR-associated protein Cas5/CasD [Streptomyces chartreusis]
MNGILLRLAAPLMSFGEHAAFRYRDTLGFPTRSALIGMFAAADGRSRDEALAPAPATGHIPYSDLVFTVRIDRPGHRHTDFHTTGGGRAHKQGLPTSDGGYRSQKASTHISHRVYLADAVFTVAVQGPDPLLEHLTQRLEQPAFAPYLGRRCAARTTDPSTRSLPASRSASPHRPDPNRPPCPSTSSGNAAPHTSPPPTRTRNSPTYPSTSPLPAAGTVPAGSGAAPKNCPPPCTPPHPPSTPWPTTSSRTPPMSTPPAADLETATLIRIRLNLSNFDIRRNMHRPGSLHKTVMLLAPEGLGDNPRQKAGLLFRLEHATHTLPPTLLAQTRLPPDLARMPATYGQPETRDLTPLLAALTAGRRVRYRITANPSTRYTIKKDADPFFPIAKPRHKDVPLDGDDALAWWQRKATRAGLDLHSAALTPMARSQHPITRERTDRPPDVFRYALTRFDGEATITDPDHLRHAVLTGIGRGKAYGAGLLSLAPA